MENSPTFTAEISDDATLIAQNPASKSAEALRQWEQTWAEYFRQDETRVDQEVQSLCDRLRALALSLEP
jgi:hypothetical protein